MKSQRAKLRRWRDQHRQHSEVVKDVIARLEGRVRKCYVLARSFTQFSNWVDGNGSPMLKGAPRADQYICVTKVEDLVGVRLSSVVVLFELDGWQAQADEALIHRVHLLYHLRQ